MNEELQERLMSYLESLEGAVSSTSDFVLEQAPMYVQELINWQIAEGLIWGSLSLMLVPIFITINFTILRSLRKDDNGDNKAFGWGLGVASFVIMAGAIVISSAWFCESVKAYMAPRVVIMEHIQNKI